jgi:hypothetical protein
MLIGINGKIGSGKDTVGKIIQGLIVAKKHNIQNPSFEWIEKYYINSTWETKKFAGKLKTVASLLTGVPVEMFEDQEFKKQYMPEEWAVEIWNDPDPIEGNDYRITSRIKYEDDTSLITYNDGLSEAEVFDHEIEKRLMTYRELLQKLGTEAMRDGLHKDAWVNALFADYYPTNDCQQHADGLFYTDEHGENEVLPEYPNWIITDMRFPNELEAVKDRGGVTIRVNRNIKCYCGHTITCDCSKENEHYSETALDNAEFDYTIDNNGTIEELMGKVREILINEKII